ncbi:hypothetical protein ACFP3Q_07020 [Nocardioides sp. GCM10027113]|uniref:hypothetical protein n=1 Tax=unclassified Nocardioides TaxID=2615069 RepID=UPI0036198F68
MISDTAPPSHDSRPRSRLRSPGVVAAVVGVLVVAGLARVGWEWRHPEAFVGYDGVGIEDTWPADEWVHIGVSPRADGARGLVRIHSVRADVLDNTAGAEITFQVCHLAGDAGADIGSVREPDLRSMCASLVPAEGATLDLDAEPLQQLVMGIRLDGPGRLAIRDVELGYSHGWQRGSQRIGDGVVLRAETG